MEAAPATTYRSPPKLASILLPGLVLAIPLVGAVTAAPVWPGRPALAIALVGQAAPITAALGGHPWQVDSHMDFFALIAILAALVDIQAIVAATLLVAAHHLALNFLAPAMVHPGGGDIGRTLVHAAILLLESGAIIFTIHQRLRLRQQPAASTAGSTTPG